MILEYQALILCFWTLLLAFLYKETEVVKSEFSRVMLVASCQLLILFRSAISCHEVARVERMNLRIVLVFSQTRESRSFTLLCILSISHSFDTLNSRVTSSLVLLISSLIKTFFTLLDKFQKHLTIFVERLLIRGQEAFQNRMLYFRFCLNRWFKSNLISLSFFILFLLDLLVILRSEHLYTYIYRFEMLFKDDLFGLGVEKISLSIFHIVSPAPFRLLLWTAIQAMI